MKFSFKACLALLAAISLVGCQLKNHEEVESEDLEMDGMEEAMKQQFKMTRDPLLNIIPSERLEIAKQRIASMLSNSNFRTMALTWQERGPNNIGGRTRTIMVDSRDATGNTVFAGSVSGGIFKTTNFSSAAPNWAPVNDQMLNLAITVLVQDRNNPSTMYAGTGEGWFNIDAVRGAGIFKSTDGGVTWNQMPSTAAFEYVQDMVIDNNGRLYVSLRNQNSAFRGVMRSTDAGATWTQVLGLGTVGSTLTFGTGRAADLEVASNGDLYATLGIFTRTQVFKSSASNGANTGAVNAWTEITPAHTVITQRGELAVAPSNPQRLYLLMQDSATSQVKSIYRSSDGGNVWDSLGAPSALNNGSVSQNWYNLIAAVDPNNADVLVVGGFHIARSTDAAASFTDINSGIHVDQHALVYLSSSNLIVGNDGGIYQSTNVNTLPITFANKNFGYNVTQFYGADFHPSTVNYFLAGAQDNNTQKFTTAGINATSAVVGGDGGFPHIDQTDGQIQIAATTGNNFYRSLDGGNSWAYLNTVSNSRGQFINPTDYDDNANTLYAGDDPGQYYYVNSLGAGPTGATKSLAQISSSREVTALKVDPFSSNTVWLGTNSLVAGVFPVILKVTDANTNTASVAISATLSSVPAGSTVSSIDVDPSNANHLLATLSNYGVTSVFESTDGGASWHTIEGNLPDMPVYWGVFAPANAQLNGSSGGNGGIILGTELGVWSTSVINGAATQWTVDANFPKVRTDMLKWRPSDFTLIAATHGRGLWTTTIPTVATGIPTVDNTRNFIKYTSANQQQLLIAVGNLNVNKMQIRIFDMNGRLVQSRETRYENQTIPIGNLPRSSYILKIYGTKGEQYTLQFVK